MKRAWSILLSILLGAAVVGMGTGYFLHLANLDRERLANEAQDAKMTAQQALNDRQHAVEEANTKLDLANQEVNKAQSTLQALKLERDLLTRARLLTMSTRSQTWPSALSTGLGLSVRYPAGSSITANDIYGLTIAASSTSRNTAATTTEPWLSITPYNAQMQQQFATRLASSTEVVYFVNGKLLSGYSGTVTSPNAKLLVSAAVLVLLDNGTSTQLIWIQDPPKPDTKTKKYSAFDTWLDVLATLDFKQ